MLRKLLSGLFWVLLLNIIVKPLWILGIEVGVQNAVGDTEYGLYFTILSLSYIFNILLDLGITNFNTRNIAQHPKLIQKHLSGILGLKIILLGVYLMVTFAAGLVSGYGSREFILLAWLCLNQFLNSMILYLRSNFEGLMLFKWDSLISVTDRVLMIIICGLLLISPFRDSFCIEWFVWAQTVAYAATLLLALIVIAHKSGQKKINWDWRFFAVIIKQSAPFALLVLLMAAYNRIDSLILKAIAGSSTAGVYAGAFRLLDAITMIAYLVSVLLLPVYSRLCKEKDNRQLATTTRLIFPAMMAFAVGVAITFSMMSPSLMHLLYSDRGMEYVGTFQIIIFGIIPIGITYIVGTLLTAAGKLKQLNIFAALSLVLNVAINIMLIPKLGAVGSAYASLTAQSFMALAQLVVTMRKFGFKLEVFRPISTIIYAIAVILINIACSALNMWLQFTIAIVAALVCAIVLRLIDIKRIIETIKKQ